MAKTQLNLELSYKGKVLDYIKHGQGVFKDKWFVGSNKYLLWQVLDPAFPDKHQLIAQKGNEFFMKLVPGAKLDCAKDGKPVDQAFLQSNGLLKGNELQLRNDMTGTMVLNPDWQIHYRFIEPYVHILTEEERQIVAQYSRRAEGTQEEKFNRGMVLLFLFLTLALLVVYDLALKPDVTDAGTLEASLAQLRLAQRVETYKPQEVQTGPRDDDAAARAAAEAAAKAAADAAAAAAAQAGRTGRTTGTPGGTGTSASSLFGEFNPNAVIRNPVAITTTRDFVAASRDGGGGGGGTGPGGGSGGPGGGGSGRSGGIASSFDPNAISSYQQSEFSSASNTGGIKGSSERPTGNVDVRGNVSQAEIAALNKPVAVTSADRAVITRISQQAPAVTENTIASAPEAARSDLEALRNAVNSRKSQLTALYRKAAAIENSGGSVNIRIYGSGNKIQTAQVTPVSGNLPTSFLEDVKRAVESWSISGVSGAFNYQFTMRFGS